MIDKNKIKGGLYGLLVGDALGVPYEFHHSSQIPEYDLIEMEPPAGFLRAHSGVKPGTWSDDGAQALCLLDSLLEKGRFSLTDFSGKLLAWYDAGLWAVDNYVFDVGNQTAEALNALRGGMSPEECGNIYPEGKGNGALMRVLPLALWHSGTDEELVSDAHRQCLITHGHITNQVCCALYCLVARRLLEGMDFNAALSHSVKNIREIYADMPEYLDEFEFRIQPDEPDIWEGNGGGYVIDSLRSVFMIMREADCYEDAVKSAVSLGDDTDTTACILGGLAGIAFGYDSIPERWIAALRGKEDFAGLLNELIEKRC